jgi:hypothetical protein
MEAGSGTGVPTVPIVFLRVPHHLSPPHFISFYLRQARQLFRHQIIEAVGIDAIHEP